MDKTIAAIKLVGEFMIASYFFHQLYLEGADFHAKISYFMTGLIVLGAFEIAFYWHIIR